MGTETAIATRARYRDSLREALEAIGELEFVEVEGGPEDGVRVLTHRSWEETLATVFGMPVPPPIETSAEVSTPASVIVSAECPICGLPSELYMTIHPELRVDEDGREIRLIAKAKPRSHVCDQLSVSFTSEDLDDQLPLGEAVSVSELRGLLVEISDTFADDDDWPSEDEISDWTEPYREKVKEWALELAAFPDSEAPFPEQETEEAET